MKRRDLFKMFATLAAMPLVAPLAAWCKANTPNVSDEYADLAFDGPLQPSTASMALDKFADWPKDAREHLIENLRSSPPPDYLLEPYTVKNYLQYRNRHSPEGTFYGRGRHGMPETWQWQDTPFDGEQS